MKKNRIISLFAAFAIAFSGVGSLSVDASAANYVVMAAKSANTSTKRTGKELSYQQAYNRLKNLSFVNAEASDKTAQNTKNKNKNNKTNNNQSTQTTTQQQDIEPTIVRSNNKDAVVFKDYYGKELSNDMYLYRNLLTKKQQYLYDVIKYGISCGMESVTFDDYYHFLDIGEAYLAVWGDNPHLSWAHSYTRGLSAPKKGIMSINFVYDKALIKDIKGTVQLMDDHLKPMLDKASKMSSDIEKIKYVHDWLIYNTNNGIAMTKDMHVHMAYSAIVDKKGVCTTYSQAFQYCMQKLGIVSTIVSGTTCNNEGHSWNLVKADGDWYELDVFWDDALTEDETDFLYTCFMQTTESLKAYDTYNGKTRTRYKFEEKLPIAKGTKYSPNNYSYTNGSDFSDLAKVVVTKRNNNYGKSSSASAKKKSLPRGWYNDSMVFRKTLDGKDISEITKSDWTKEGSFYYISSGNSGSYYVYDVKYDNYYYCLTDLSYIAWFDYNLSKTGCWKPLK